MKQTMDCTKRISILFAFSILLSLSALSQETWKGFEKKPFEIDGYNGYVIIPPKATEGNPWLWRARFPNYNAQPDSILIAEGFHLVHINTAHLFGHESAMKIWDKTYFYVTQEYQLAYKTSLHGVSRGGLFVYHWASRNPDKVASIYTEAPVCDFKSWPGGFGDSEGSPKDWQRLKEVYGFSNNQEARASQAIPLNYLQPIAHAKIPLFNMVGLKDEIVPYAENTKKLAERYIELGGYVTVHSCTLGETSLKGHHFPTETPRMVADFVKYHNQGQKLNPQCFHLGRSGIPQAIQTFKNSESARVAFLGGSITYNGGWRDSLMHYFEKTYPSTSFEFINAGIPSMGSTPSAFRLQRDVISKGKIDLLFVEAAVNDDTNRRTKEEQLLALEGVVRHTLKTNPDCEIVLMHFVDPGKIESYRKGSIPFVIRNHESIAAHYDIPSLNLAKEVQERIDHEEFTWEDDFINLHPSPFGQGVYAHSMIHFLESERLKMTPAVYEKMPPALSAKAFENGRLIEAISLRKVKGFKKVTKWTAPEGERTRSNYSNTSFLIAEKPGAKLTFQFEGNAVGIAVAAGPDAGMIKYRIDKGDWQEQDLFTKWSQNLHLPWYYTLAKNLDDGKHTLELQTIEGKNPDSKGTACRIRYLYVNQ